MSNTLKLALQLTAVDMMSGILDRAKHHVVGLGQAGADVSRHFDLMNQHLSQGLKGFAAAHYAMTKLAAGIAPAADMQEVMLKVEMSLAKSWKSAADLNKELVAVRSTSNDLQKITPFSGVEMAESIREFLNSGVALPAVVGNGAAKATAAFATITDAPLPQAQATMLNVGVPYHLPGTGYVEVADVLQRHIMSGRLKTEGFQEALKVAAGVAKSFKVPWKDMVTGLAVIGESGFTGSDAGTYFKDFLGRLTGASRISRKMLASANQSLKQKGKQPLRFWDKKRELLPLHDIIKNMRASFGDMDTQSRNFLMSKIFEEQGRQGALALMKDGPGGWEAVEQRQIESSGLDEKMKKRLEGLNAQRKSLEGTKQTTLATIFTPMLGALTQVDIKLNDIVAKVGTLAEEFPKITKVGNYLAGGVAVGAGAYGIYHLGKAALAGGKVLKGVGGFGGLLSGGASTAIGIAEGKALQAATGVQPVFVTNWPVGMGGLAGAPGTAGSVAGGAAESVAGGVAGGWAARTVGKMGAFGMSALTAGVELAIAYPVTAFAGATTGLLALAYAANKLNPPINLATAKFDEMGNLIGEFNNIYQATPPLPITQPRLTPEASLYAVGSGIDRHLDMLGESIFEMVRKNGETKNNIQLNISIDPQGRVVTESNDPNTRSTINLKRGEFEPGVSPFDY